MKHKKCVKLLTLLLCTCLLMAGCQTGESTTASTTGQTEPGETLYTVSVRTDSGAIPMGLEYYVYKNESLLGIQAYGTLMNNGSFEFTAPTSDTYTLVFKGMDKVGMDEGYEILESYTLTPNTEIVFKSGIVQDKEPAGKQYVLGDMMRDFTVTDTEGNTYTISELLKTKKAVVLNFWNIKCDPCKSEFPYLQKAYEAYKDDIALLAIDPVGSDKMDMIADFKAQFGLTFPMGPCDPAWVQALAPANPTTVIIDRYGRICVKETGAIPEEGIFEKVFAHFVAEDYQQILIKNMEEFAKEA